MIRALVATTLALGMIVSGCSGSPKKMGGASGGEGEEGGQGGVTDPQGNGTGGNRGGGRGGKGGDAGAPGGRGGESGSGGADAAGGAAGEADAAIMSSLDGPLVSTDARTSDGGAGEVGDPGGDTLPGKPWIHLCPRSYTKEQCCAFLCNCLATICADSPQDAARQPTCMSMCMGLNDMAMRCHVYHCYESTNPNVTKDHVSHCGHASGRVGGGGCPTAVYQ
jgi:hypothetical protein